MIRQKPWQEVQMQFVLRVFEASLVLSGAKVLRLDQWE